VIVFRISHESDGHVFDHGHVLRPVLAAQSRELVMEDDIENPLRKRGSSVQHDAETEGAAWDIAGSRNVPY
jgi:hypothetical protein